jgi:DNA (cytosine-5)-methyltransferase 1
MSRAYYNEIDKYAADWLRNLIAAGHIAPGDVDERSIEDVEPSDLIGYTQCHFFAGVGVWSYALRRAGWPDDRPVWTGSCPCQPFSAAGKGAAFTDERHLWPAFHHLIRECNPAVVFGEQVASKDADAWIDLVQTDLEALDYAFGAVAFPSAGIGAPHIRDRTYWVANAGSIRRQRWQDSGRSAGEISAERRESLSDIGGGVSAGRLDNADNARLEGLRSGHSSAIGYGETAIRSTAEAGELGGMADADGGDAGAEGLQRGWKQRLIEKNRRSDRLVIIDADSGPGPTNGFWRSVDWLGCRDGKWRPVEPGTFPLAHGATSRVGRLRAYGNAINAEAAVAFIQAYEEAGLFL